jgi:hypothetical protein
MWAQGRTCVFLDAWPHLSVATYMYAILNDRNFLVKQRERTTRNGGLSNPGPNCPTDQYTH